MRKLDICLGIIVVALMILSAWYVFHHDYVHATYDLVLAIFLRQGPKQ